LDDRRCLAREPIALSPVQPATITVAEVDVKRVLLAGMCLALAACGDAPPVIMRNPESGVIVKCGASRGADSQQKCIEDFQKQGMERAS
jgi:hypothetical protein